MNEAVVRILFTSGQIMRICRQTMDASPILFLFESSIVVRYFSEKRIGKSDIKLNGDFQLGAFRRVKFLLEEIKI
jgi:hypothetical protein